MTEVRTNSALGFSLYRKTLSSGLKCYIIPKYGSGSISAMAVVGCGSADVSFRHYGRSYHLPAGTAHFVEHKLFEEPWGDQFAAFAAAGASANAFTDFEKTAYYFTSRSCGEENLRRLLSFVNSPYFTEEAVVREREIIGRELDMYADDPQWQTWFLLLESLYPGHPVCLPIGGTRESIAAITPQILYEHYRAFYQPQNMAVLCVGDIAPERFFFLAEQAFPRRGKPLPLEEPALPQKADTGVFREKTMDVALPLFQMGLRYEPWENSPQSLYEKRVFFEAVLGESSLFQAEMEQKGLLDSPLQIQCVRGKNVAFAALGDRSKDPQAVCDAILARLQHHTPTAEETEQARCRLLGAFYQGAASAEALLMAQAEYALAGWDLTEVFSAIGGIKHKTIINQLPLCRAPEAWALAAVRGEEQRGK